MGGKNQWKHKQQGQGGDYRQDYRGDYKNPGGGGSWHVWRGAWSSPKGGREQELRYDQITPLTSTEVRQSSVFADEDPGYSNGIQKALTTAKKADVRVRKLTEERELRLKQWDAYVADTKARFLKQRRIFEQDVARIEREREEAMEHGRMAAGQMKALVVGCGAPAPMEVQNTDHTPAWDALWRSVSEVPAENGFLQEAMEVARASGMTGLATGVPSMPATMPPPPNSAPARAHPTGPPPGFENRQQAYASELAGQVLGGHRQTDPYMHSPVPSFGAGQMSPTPVPAHNLAEGDVAASARNAHTCRSNSGPRPGPYTPPQSRADSATPAFVPAHPVFHQDATAAEPTLEQRLEMKRAMAMAAEAQVRSDAAEGPTLQEGAGMLSRPSAAMRPFGRPMGGAPPNTVQAPSFLEDDDEELEDVPNLRTQ